MPAGVAGRRAARPPPRRARPPRRRRIRGARAAQAPAAAPAADTWPHTVTGENGTATVYQPQVIAWPEHRTLTARVAIGVTPNGAKAPMFGVVEVAFDTQTELAERTVVLTAPRLVSREVSVGGPDAGRAVRSADPRGARRDGRQARAARERRAEPRAAGDEARGGRARQHAAAHLRQHARRRASSCSTASRCWRRSPARRCPFVVNTNWDVFVDNATRTWYLLNDGGWLAAPDAKGPWMPAGPLPPSFAALPADANFAEREEADPRPADERRRTRRPCSSATTPAAIIVINGPPQYVRSAARRCSTWRTPTPRCSGTRPTAATTTWCRAAGSRRPGSTGRGRSPRRACPPDFARIPAERAARLRARVRARHAAGAGSADRGADSAAGNAASRRGEARRRLRGRAEVRADRGHADELRGQHVVQRGPDGRRLFLVLPGRVVRRTRARRTVDARGERAAGRLHDPAREPDVPVHVRARVRGDPADGHVRRTRRATR